MRYLAGAVVVAALFFQDGAATADEHDPTCRVVDFEMMPSDDLQIVVWLEDDAGNFVETLYITRLTGTYGLGNRPGIMDFDSAWRWPYGRRESTFPVWAHRHGMEWPRLIFQNLDDQNLSHPLGQSSIESFYCRPLRDGEAMWDTETCASTVYTDKGQFHVTEKSLYPPRSDLSMVAEIDDLDVEMFAALNPFDAVSRATPPGGEMARLGWAIPDDLPDGNYVAWVEVNKEFDQNQYYEYFEPQGIPWADYGLAYRGQPSVVYRVPFELGQTESIGTALDYEGYGDPDGLDGDIRVPDNTITTGTVGSGASRLMVVPDGDGDWRVQVSARPTFDAGMPGAADEFKAVEVSQTHVVASFVAPGDDGMEGTVSGYEIRISAGEPITEENFADATVTGSSVAPDSPGTVQLVTVEELLPRTNYYIAIRAYDECFNYGPMTTLHVTTPDREPGTVDACFIATAAYGSVMATDVSMLRDFRDTYLRTNVPGELAVEAYYTFGPAVAEVVDSSDTLRRMARALLGPVVDAVRE